MLLWGKEDPNKHKSNANKYEIKENDELSKNFNTLGDVEAKRSKDVDRVVLDKWQWASQSRPRVVTGCPPAIKVFVVLVRLRSVTNPWRSLLSRQTILGNLVSFGSIPVRVRLGDEGKERRGRERRGREGKTSVNTFFHTMPCCHTCLLTPPSPAPPW